MTAPHARLEGLIQQRDQALATEKQWIQWYEEMEKERKLMFNQIHNFQIRMDEMEHLIREWEDKARKEHVQRLEEEINYLTQIVQLEERLEEHEHITKHSKMCFSQLAALANGAIEDVPRMLREADVSLTFHIVPKEVETLLDHCKWLVGLMKNMVARNKN